MVGFSPVPGQPMNRARRPRRIALRASAKVNLALDVLGKRPDGYHEIATVMHAVDLHDRLTLEAAPTLSFHADDPGLPMDEGNLVVRAARLLREAAGVEAGGRGEGRKGSPVAAGLRGSSRGPAAARWGVGGVCGAGWPRARLMELGTRIGMAVPFFLGPGPALATGRGEHLEPLRVTGGYALVLVNPGVGLSTREVYERVPAGWKAEATGARGGGEALRLRGAARLGAALSEPLESGVWAGLAAVRRVEAE